MCCILSLFAAGSAKGKKYFTCPAKHGGFCKPEVVKVRAGARSCHAYLVACVQTGDYPERDLFGSDDDDDDEAGMAEMDAAAAAEVKAAAEAKSEAKTAGGSAGKSAECTKTDCKAADCSKAECASSAAKPAATAAGASAGAAGAAAPAAAAASENIMEEL